MRGRQRQSEIIDGEADGVKDQRIDKSHEELVIGKKAARDISKLISKQVKLDNIIKMIDRWAITRERALSSALIPDALPRGCRAFSRPLSWEPDPLLLDRDSGPFASACDLQR